MERNQVLTTLDSLANGLDPTTGARIPHDLFASPDVIRALFTAASLLRSADGEETPAPRAGSRPTAAGQRWTEQEDALLCHAFDGGTPVADIARQHGRTKGAITLRLVKLGRIDPETVKTRERGVQLTA
jgi:hypothetical protein